MSTKDNNPFSCRGEAYEALDDIPINSSTSATLGDVVQARMGRRDFVQQSLVVTALSTSSIGRALAVGAGDQSSHLSFAGVSHGVDDTHHVAKGYKAEILIRWGDAINKSSPSFDPMKQSVTKQLAQFGYNNDYIGYIPLPFGSQKSDHGLLCINHEYVNEEVMFPGFAAKANAIPKEWVDIEMAAHGGSIIEVIKKDGKWRVVADSLYSRRINAYDSKMELTGAASGHARVKTSADPSGTKVIGTLNNCAGGITPWGTYLMAEENFHGYFLGELPKDHLENVNHTRYGVPAGEYQWGKHYDRFNLSKEPNEPNRHGWIVEVDPFNRDWAPKKHTSMGRFRHEGAETIVNKDGRVVVYSGDDARFEYLYKFVSNGKFNPAVRAANLSLLEEGTLYVAKFEEAGRLQWLPLVHGSGPLTKANGFDSQADVLIETRRAADLLGATPMDRPEDVEPNPLTGKVYVMLTNNNKRTPEQVNVANTRAVNDFGHIIEITTPDKDHAALESSWDILVQCGDPKIPAVRAQWNAKTGDSAWFASPDNCAIDKNGNLWVSTDQGSNWARTGTADGLYALETDGSDRGLAKMFFRVPIGAELCGPCFTPDSKTLFLAVQHPGTDGTKFYKGFERESTFEDPATRWPDFKPGMPPRPSVVVITHEKNKEIGSA